ncbi:hypothetical protein BK742_13875 [Bacillus thuringiensis serovar pingluonsis]|uniref:Uncharacterized protein n=1 Tax=Bacillus thuringiensis serovar pingluonsis TaxID=180881 RepID=A0A243BE11_BACTU|nr:MULTISPECIES: hypothetical protein [Bacillus cereus group]MEB9683728.1 hypothetical protein [Bacillus anthracis]OTY44165.1 hypothetical protein BK742_13875 [Bacillus thuringiensis serovar pingluonsis]
MNQIDFSSIQSPVNQLALQAAIMFLAMGVTGGLVYYMLLKIHAPKQLASVIATVCTLVVAFKTISILFT